MTNHPVMAFPSRSRARRATIAALVGVCLFASAAAQAREPIDFIPADALICWVGRPLPDTTPLDDQPSTLTTLIDLGSRIAGQPLPEKASVTMRMLEAVTIMIRYQHAAAILDAKAIPLVDDPEGRKVDQFKVAIVIEDRGHADRIRRIIQKAINETTSASTATLETLTAGGWRYQELRDSRLADWWSVAWGEIDDHFVLTFGRDVWPQIAATVRGERAAMSADPWVQEVRSRRANDSVIEIIAQMRAIRERLDPYVQNRAGAFLRAWQADRVDRTHWALGFEGRAMFCEAAFLGDGKTSTRVFADPATRDDRIMPAIPETARYAIYKLSAAETFERFFGGMLATRVGSQQQRITALWERIQREVGVDVRRDLLANLGEYWVMHNYPPHPLHIPMAMTTMVEIRSNPTEVATFVERVCTAWKAAETRYYEETGELLPVLINRDGDGIWYVQLGLIAGPAWTVTDRFILTSWSPMALRTYLQTAGDAAGKRIQIGSMER